MRVAIALIHYKAVTPTYLIVEVSDDFWHQFLHSNQRVRQEMTVPKLKPHLVGNIREMAWLPLDNQSKLQIVDEKSVIRL